MIGQVVGNYKITEKVGEGGMGEVFKGIDIMIDRKVAIKMLRSELARQQAIVERFRAEALTLGKLSHPNIAVLYSFIRQRDNYFMVMEYVEGNTIEQIIKTNGAIPVERAIHLFCQALEGIAHAHRFGIIHRDLKPANLMLTQDGLMKVMDFGIARAIGSSRMTRSGNIIGTIEYMSPEQVRGEETDARSDIYSAGILLYEMLTGRVPFESTSEYELMRRQIEDAPIPPRTFSSQIPLPLEQAIMRALAKKKEARFQTAEEFRLTLLKSISQFAAQSHPRLAEVKAAKEKVITLVDGSKPAVAVVKETKLAGEVLAINETRLKVEPPIIKETRLPAVPVQNNSAKERAIEQQATVQQAEIPAQARPEKLASLKQLNWKPYVGILLLALLTIPIVWLMSGSKTRRDTDNKNTSRQKAPAWYPSTNGQGDSTTGVSTEEEKPLTNDHEVKGKLPPSSKGHPAKARGGSAKTTAAHNEPGAKAQDESTPPPQAGKEATKEDNADKKAKKEDSADADKKAKEKKGGIFGVFKKLNPFKKKKD